MPWDDDGYSSTPNSCQVKPSADRLLLHAVLLLDAHDNCGHGYRGDDDGKLDWCRRNEALDATHVVTMVRAENLHLSLALLAERREVVACHVSGPKHLGCSAGCDDHGCHLAACQGSSQQREWR